MVVEEEEQGMVSRMIGKVSVSEILVREKPTPIFRVDVLFYWGIFYFISFFCKKWIKL